MEPMRGFEIDTYRIWVQGDNFILEDKTRQHNAIRIYRGDALQVVEMILRLSASIVRTPEAQTRPIFVYPQEL